MIELLIERLRVGMITGQLTLSQQDCEEYWEMLKQNQIDNNTGYQRLGLDLLAATRKIEEFKHACNKAVVNGVPLLRVNEELKSLVAEADTSLLNKENKCV